MKRYGVLALAMVAAMPSDARPIEGAFQDDAAPYGDSNVQAFPLFGTTPLPSGGSPSMPAVTAAQLLSGAYDNQRVTLEGLVQDAFPDELDPNFSFLVLAGPDLVYVAVRHPPGESPADRLIGCEITVAGTVSPPCSAVNRRQTGRLLGADSPDDIFVRQRPQEDPFAMPELADIRMLPPGELARCGRRRQVGRVLAVWDGTEMLLRTPEKTLTRISLAIGPPPKPGDFVETVGNPETDLYNLNLTRADWRATTAFADDAEAAPVDVRARDVMATDAPHVHAEHFGRAVRLVGEVCSVPTPGNVRGKLLIADGNAFIPVDITAAGAARKKLRHGCKVEVAGICVLDLENWRPNAAFPTVRGFQVVLRNADDLRILRAPPFWTPLRLLGLLAALVAGLVGFSVWNIRLRRLVERRGRELAKGAIAQAEADLRTCERTRLAVELHDSVAQNLTGSILEMRLAKALTPTDPEVADRHLSLAMKIVEATREELRDCIWDLRNRALEETDVNTAILTTLAPHAEANRLSVRVHVPRERISDSTMHAILQILRELTVNALRHGHAKNVRIAGALEGGRLLFSVRDDGCGFDPNACPSMAEGHFGLEGVRERLRALGGEFSLESGDAGTRASFSVGLGASRLLQPHAEGPCT